MRTSLGTVYSTIWARGSHTIKPGFLPLCDCLFLKDRLMHLWATRGNASAAVLCGRIQHYRSSQWFLQKEKHSPCIFLPLRAERVWGEGSKHSRCLGISLKRLLLIHSLQLQPDVQAMRGTRPARLPPAVCSPRCLPGGDEGANTALTSPKPACTKLPLAHGCAAQMRSLCEPSSEATRGVSSSVPCLHLVMLTTPKDAWLAFLFVKPLRRGPELQRAWTTTAPGAAHFPGNGEATQQALAQMPWVSWQATLFSTKTHVQAAIKSVVQRNQKKETSCICSILFC